MSRYRLGITHIENKTIEKFKEDCGRPLDQLKAGHYDIYYGFDHALGYFLMGWDVREDEEEPAFSFDSMFNGLTGSRLAYFLSTYGGNKEHIHLSAMDWDF